MLNGSGTQGRADTDSGQLPKQLGSCCVLRPCPAHDQRAGAADGEFSGACPGGERMKGFGGYGTEVAVSVRLLGRHAKEAMAFEPFAAILVAERWEPGPSNASRQT